MLSFDQTKDVVANIVAAGNEALHIWPAGQTKRPLDPQKKRDGSFVTAGDYLVNSLLVDYLGRVFPHDGILSEELPPSAEIYAAERYWVIDPIDGTHNFMAGSKEFAVLLALWQGSQCLFGCGYFPAKNHLVYATRGQPAYFNQETLRVSASKSFGHGRVAALGSSKLDQALLYKEELNSYAALLKFCKAELDAVLIPITSHGTWDVAPIPAIVEASGGMATDENGQAFKFNLDRPGFKWMVISNGLTHEAALECIK